MLHASSIDDVQEAVRGQESVRVSAGGTKPALSGGANLSVQQLRGVVQYQPTEYTFTALAGTTVSEVQQMLSAHGQYLPFDPPLVDAGATLGGTVAAGLSGAGRFRYGGVRDFLIGVRFVSGRGELVTGGGKVVKNAAGFDIPKLMVGSLGRYGVLVELTFKVFPARQASTTVAIDLPDLPAAVQLMNQLAASSEDLDHLDLEPPGRVTARISGMRDALSTRVERLKRLLPASARLQQIDDDQPLWREVREFLVFPADHALIKVPLVPDRIVEMEAGLAALPADVLRRYSVGGNVAWIAWPPALDVSQLESLLNNAGSRGLVLRGPWTSVFVNDVGMNAFAQRLLSVFDPDGKFRR